MPLPMALPLIIGAVGSVASGAIQAGAASSAARRSADASREATEAQERMGYAQIDSAERIADQQTQLAYDINEQARGDLAPWRQAGQNALNRYADQVNQPFQETDAYRFQLGQGIKALEDSAAGSGQLFSGRTGKAMMDYGQGLASQEYGTYLNRLSGLASTGQGAAAGQAGFSMQTGSTINNALATQGGMTAGAYRGIGDAQATGAINRGNAYAAGAIGTANALSGTLSNLTNLAGYHSTMFPDAYG